MMLMPAVSQLGRLEYEEWDLETRRMIGGNVGEIQVQLCIY